MRMLGICVLAGAGWLLLGAGLGEGWAAGLTVAALLALGWARGICPPGRLVRWPGFLVFMAGKILVANLGIAWRVVRPMAELRPVLLRYPMAAPSDVQATALGLCITLTPGTLFIQLDEVHEGETAPDRYLWIQAIHAPDTEALVADIRSIEARVREVFT